MFFSVLEDFEDKVLDLSDYNEDETKAFLADIAEVRPIDIELLKGQINLADEMPEIKSEKKQDANTRKRKNSSQGNTSKFDIRLKCISFKAICSAQKVVQPNQIFLSILDKYFSNRFSKATTNQ